MFHRIMSILILITSLVFVNPAMVCHGHHGHHDHANHQQSSCPHHVQAAVDLLPTGAVGKVSVPLGKSPPKAAFSRIIEPFAWVNVARLTPWKLLLYDADRKPRYPNQIAYLS